MLLKNELLKQEALLFEKASVRERLFYLYLLGKKSPQFNIDSLGEIDKVCAIVFAGIDKDISADINRLQKTKEIKGVHFSTNLISLIAFALKSEQVKERYLEDFFMSHGLKEKFFISHIFTNYKLPSSAKPEDALEKLISTVFILKDFANAESLLFPAFEAISDLNDLYIIRAAYKEILKIHPNTELQMKYSELSDNVITLIAHVQRTINRAANALVVLFGIILAPSIIYLTKHYWIRLELEPYITGGGIAMSILSVLFMILYNSNPEWFKYSQKFRHWLLTKWFKKRGLKLKRLQELVDNAKRGE